MSTEIAQIQHPNIDAHGECFQIKIKCTLAHLYNKIPIIPMSRGCKKVISKAGRGATMTLQKF